MGTKVRVVAVLWFWAAVNYLDRVAITFAGPSMMKSLSLSPAHFGIVLSAFFVGYLIAQIPGGFLTDRFGTKLVLVISPLFWALFTALTGLATTIVSLVAVRICLGLAEGLSIAALTRAIGDEFPPHQRAAAMGTMLTGLAVGPAVAGPLVGALTHAYGWQVMFMLLVAPALLASLLNATLFPSAHPPHAHDQVEATGSLRSVLMKADFWIIGGFYLAYNMAFWGFVGWMPSYLSMARHISLTSLGPLASVTYAFAFVGLLVGGWLGTGYLRRHRAHLIGVSVFCAGLSLIAAYLAHDLFQALAGLSSAAFFLYGCQGCFGAVLLDLAPPKYRAAYAALVSTFGQVGGLLAPAIVGFLLSHTGAFASGFAFMVVALVAATGLMFALITPLSRVRARLEQVALVN